MKILIYGINYAPEPTGTGKYNTEMAEWLVQRGHTVKVITGLPHYPQWNVPVEYKNNQRKNETINGVTIRRLAHFVPSVNKVTGLSRILLETSFNFNALLEWVPILFSIRKYDMVLVISPPLQLTLFTLLYSKVRGVPVWLHIQDLQVDAAFRLGIIKENILTKALYMFESFILKKSTHVSTITSAMRRRVIEKCSSEKHVTVFPNWADTTVIKPLIRENKFRQDILKVKRDSLLFLYAGNIGRKQGLELILHAAKQVESHPEIVFYIVGDGVDKDRLLKLKSELCVPNVNFLPVQPIENLSEMLSAADVHLVIQKSEATDLVMPSKLTNIMASGRPIIVTALPNTELHDVTTQHSTGIVINPEDEYALAEAIKLMAKDKLERKTMGQNARAYAVRNLNKNNILSEFESQLIRKGRTSS